MPPLSRRDLLGFLATSALGCGRRDARAPNAQGAGGAGACPLTTRRPRSTLPGALRTEARTLTTRQHDGFSLLGVGTVLSTDPEFVPAVAEDEAELCHLARAAHSSMCASVDFRRFLVLAFAQPDPGCRVWHEPAALQLSPQAELVADLVWPSPCVWGPSGENRDLIRFLAIARTSLPSEGFRFRDRAGRLVDVPLFHPQGRLPIQAPEPDRPDIPAHGPLLGECELPLPDAGARLTRLYDGRFVWVIRHQDGHLSVLEGRHPASPFEGYPGLGKLLLWDSQLRRLDDVYDEYGASRSSPNLTRYAAHLDGDIVRIGSPMAALGRKLTEPFATNRVDLVRTLREGKALLAAFPWLAPAEALRAAAGSTVLLDASLEFGPYHAPRLLAGAERPNALPVNMLSGLEQIRTPERYVALGPLVARVRAERFLDVALTRAVVPIFRTNSVVRRHCTA